MIEENIKIRVGCYTHSSNPQLIPAGIKWQKNYLVKEYFEKRPINGVSKIKTECEFCGKRFMISIPSIYKGKRIRNLNIFYSFLITFLALVIIIDAKEVDHQIGLGIIGIALLINPLLKAIDFSLCLRPKISKNFYLSSWRHKVLN